ncbi:MAG: alkaline phosphatase family protein [Chloroflexi bacterium]|nr:alkaline phosphatase family protein [Chloroflexota bacterium]
MPQKTNPANIILGPIIGGLSHDRANLWARTNKASTLHAWIATNKNGANAKLAGRKRLQDSTGFAGMVTVTGLSPSKKYYFAFSLDPQQVPTKSAFSSFETFPAPGKVKSFRFGFGSCFLPFTETPGLAFKHIRENQPNLAFLFMLGDQVYADNVKLNGLGRIPVNEDEYRRVYHHVWSNLHHRELLARTPTFMILDDHEVDNDWHWTDRELSKPGTSWLTRLLRKLNGRPKEEQLLSLPRTRAALKVNWEHQVMHGPRALSPNGPLAYEFEYGACAFFIMDTRTPRFINTDERQMLGDKQWKMLELWLKRVKDTHPVKFIVSSISILSDIFGDITNDRWTGFDGERERLFALIAREKAEGIHFLTGDLHTAHSISADVIAPDGEAIRIWEFCSSPFEQKSSLLARLMDYPTRSPTLRNQKRHYAISRFNYGVINVAYSKGKKPRVSFELNYEKNGEWMKR